MSRKDSTNPVRVDPHPVRHESQTEREKRKKRQRTLLVLVFIFCLVTFTVTSAMSQVFGRWWQWIRGGPPVVARLELPSGPAKIEPEEYRAALWLTGDRDATDADIIAMAVLRRLADEYSVIVTDQELIQRIDLLLRIYQIPYEQLWRSSFGGFGRPTDFEEHLREVMRVEKVAGLLSKSAVVTAPEAVAEWARRREELRADYATWEGKDFLEAARQETPTDEQLAAFYESGLTPLQRSQLEREEALQFDALVLSSDALGTEAVQAWAAAEEPTEAQLTDFYERQKYMLYSRPLPAEGEEPPADWTPIRPREEVGEQLARDYRLYAAAEKLQSQAAGAADLAAFAAEKGVELVPQGEFTALSELADLPRIGTPNLRSLYFLEPGQWGRSPLLSGDLAYVARLAQKRERELPALAEIRDSVVDYWHEQRADELAKAAAEAFVAGLPRPDGAAAGDPVVLDEAAFGAAVAASNRPVQVLDWISRIARPTTDPKWDREERLRPWLRDQIGSRLDEYEDGRVLTPLHLTEPSIHVVARVAGRRPLDPARLWPGELELARREGLAEAQRRFQEEQLSYAGLSRAFLIERELAEAPPE
ncbi:MAG: hypothetical protein EYC70_03250 [Planctomycetota bacterium]|nr:MAG: hypothetical protein EYC70_03250 [Planctomycetota bacterium]